jgi:PEP-CTERM motif
MKKILLTSALTAIVGGFAYGQGVVSFSTISFANVTAQTNATVFSPFSLGNNVAQNSLGTSGAVGAAGGLSTGTGFYYTILVGGAWNGSTGSAATNGVVPSSYSALGSWSAENLTATNSATAGRLQVYGANATTSASVTSPWTYGSTNYIMLVGWSANLGSSYSTAYSNMHSQTYLNGLGANAYFGISNLGWINPSSVGSGNGVAIFGSSVNSGGTPIQSLNVQLDVLGVAATPEPGTMALAALGGASLLLFRRRK